MNSKKRLHSRGPLIYACVVSLLCVMTSAVSTFAWFQANASASVVSSGTYTSISVSKGLDYTFYAYVGNFAGNNTANALTGYRNTTPSGTFATDFKEIGTPSLSADHASNTDRNPLWPGRMLSYCIKVEGTKNKLKMFIDYTSPASATKKVGSSFICLSWAIDMYLKTSTDGSGYSTFLTQTSPDNDPSDVFDAKTTTYNSTTNPILTDTTAAHFSSGTIYIFYTILYSEQSKDLYVQSNSTTYVASSSGTSDCFENLAFQLTHVTLTDNF